MMTLGMKRLGVVLGVVATVAWVIYIGVVSSGFVHIQPLGWLIFFVGVPASFGVMFLVVWGVDWIIAGFRSGAKR